MKTISPRSPSPRLEKLDGRTVLARRAKERRKALIDHVGGKPSATQSILIEQAIMLQMRMDLMDNLTATSGGGTGMGDGDDRRYLAWSNSLARLMKQLGQKSAPRPTLSLADHLARRAAG